MLKCHIVDLHMAAPSYAARLSPYDNKGILGVAERPDEVDVAEKAARDLAIRIRNAKGAVVVHTGAGLSTSAGIRDFRGPRGVWTEERRAAEERKGKRAEKAKVAEETSVKEEEGEEERPRKRARPEWDHDVDFALAEPTFAHRALARLAELGFIRFVVTQNVDGLHAVSGLPEDMHVELHGCIFKERCPRCKVVLRRDFDVGTVGFRATGRKCPHGCRGSLRDLLLDWDDALDDEMLVRSDRESRDAALSLCLGTSLQIVPARDLPRLSKEMVIVNLQPTPMDARADVVIRSRIDDVMRIVCQELDVAVPPGQRTRELRLAVADSPDGWALTFTSALPATDDERHKLPIPWLAKLQVDGAAVSASRTCTVPAQHKTIAIAATSPTGSTWTIQHDLAPGSTTLTFTS